MIKNINIENFAGIKKFVIDFTQKNISRPKTLDEQILVDDKDCISLIPTFLAKNAAGKTSFIKALSFALSFTNKKTFQKQIDNFSSAVISDIEKKHKYGPIGELAQEKNFITRSSSIGNSIEKIKYQVFSEISYIGSKETVVDLQLTKNRNVLLDATNNSLIIKLNNITIDIFEIVENIVFDFLNYNDQSRSQQRKYHESLINDQVSKINFYKGINYKSFFKGTASIITVNELFIKHITPMFIDSLIKQWGFNAVKVLLTKIDKNIKNVAFDIEEKTFDIYIKDSDVPISPQNLSFGTQKILEILAQSITLFKHGGIMMIDEIENGLHLSLIKLIVAMYEDEDINIGKAQLLLTTHNPLISEREIVHPRNVYMSEGKTFKNVRDIKLANQRTYDNFKKVKAKNYYNDLFWFDNNIEPKSSLSNLAIKKIMQAVENGTTWRQE